MSSKIGLASTIFGGAGTDEVMAADIYAVDETSTKTSFVSKLDNLGYKAAELIRNDPYAVQNLLTFATEIRQNTGASMLENISRVKNVMPNGMLASISKMGDKGVSVIEGLASKVGISPELVGKVKTVAGEVAGTLIDQATYGDLDRFSVLSALVNDSSVFRYLNLEQEVLLASEIFSQAAGSGMFSDLLNGWENQYDEDVYRYGLSYAVPQIIYLGDLESMKAVIGKIGVAAFMMQAPNVVQDVLTSFKIPYGTLPTGYQALFNDLVSTLRLVDPTFPLIASTVRQTGEPPVTTGTIDFRFCTNLSEDAKLLFHTVGTLDFQIMAMHGAEYPTVTKETLFNEFYPESAIGQTE